MLNLNIGLIILEFIYREQKFQSIKSLNLLQTSSRDGWVRISDNTLHQGLSAINLSGWSMVGQPSCHGTRVQDYGDTV